MIILTKSFTKQLFYYETNPEQDAMSDLKFNKWGGPEVDQVSI